MLTTFVLLNIMYLSHYTNSAARRLMIERGNLNENDLSAKEEAAQT